MVSPVGNHLGGYSVLVPIAGALIIGVMARYGSERIRGHGIPEAIEAILINGSRVEPKVALLKPLSSAISIGSGGPFGAEGNPAIAAHGLPANAAAAAGGQCGRASCRSIDARRSSQTRGKRRRNRIAPVARGIGAP